MKYLVTDTGFGTGLDVRPNPGIGFPGIANYFPVTKGDPGTAEDPLSRRTGAGSAAGLPRSTSVRRTAVRARRNPLYPPPPGVPSATRTPPGQP